MMIRRGLGLLPAMFLLLAAKGGAPAEQDPQLETAIRKVYPALVQIRVISPQHEDGREQKAMASGSGAIISPEGHVLTNHHVAGRALAMRCVLTSKEELEAVRVGTDALTDLCILKLDLSARPKDAPPLPVAKFAEDDGVQVGQTVLAMGCPLSLSQSVTKGIVTNPSMILPRFSRALVLDGENVGALVKWIGHDALIQPGNSGGPLVNLQGNIVGVNEIGVGAMSGAIPGGLAKAVTRDLLQTGRVKRAWFGASFQPLFKTVPSGAQGVVVSGVLEHSPAAEAGLAPGDLITAVDGAPVAVRFAEELPAFHILLFSKPAGQPVKLKVQREQKELECALTPVLRDDALDRQVESKEWGLTVMNLTRMVAKQLLRPDTRGVAVGSVRNGGPAQQAVPALQTWDVIVGLNGQACADVAGFQAATAEALKDRKAPAPVLVAFERQGQQLLAVVEVGIRPPTEPAPEARRAWFPAASQVLSKSLAKALGLEGKKGVRLTQIYPQSAAEKAGFRVGDVITQLDGAALEASEPQHLELFNRTIRAYKVGAEVEFTVLRDRKPVKIAMRLPEAPKPEQECRTHEDVVLEFKARDLTYLDRVSRRWDLDETGVLVTQVAQGGWAAVGGLAAGDLLQGANGQPVTNVRDLEAQLKDLPTRRPKHLTFFVRRGIQTLYLELQPSWPQP